MLAMDRARPVPVLGLGFRKADRETSLQPGIHYLRSKSGSENGMALGAAREWPFEGCLYCVPLMWESSRLP